MSEAQDRESSVEKGNTGGPSSLQSTKVLSRDQPEDCENSSYGEAGT